MGKLSANNISLMQKIDLIDRFRLLLGLLSLIIFGFFIKEYFYNSITQRVVGYCSGVSNIIKSYCDGDKKCSIDELLKYMESITQDENLELMVFDETDEIIFTSSGFLPEDIQSHPDYWQSKNPAENLGIWKGKSLANEKVLAITQSIYDSNENYIGAIRCVVSLEKANIYILIFIIVMFVLEIIIEIILFLNRKKFQKNILYPIKNICEKSQLISRGNFNTRIEEKYEGYLEKIKNSINNMAQELRESEKLKNDFISSVSHELRTPLTAIKGWAETMQICDSDQNTIKRGLEIIVSEAERLSWIVEGMLDFSGINEKRVSLIKEKIDVLAELTEAVYMFKNRAKSENKTIIYSEPKIISTILGDKNRLKQVFINIIDNALKYTSDGGGISVNVSEKNNNIHISVTDNGCGIPIEHLPNVTRKFYKANHSQKGSGIGLAIVDEFVRLHDGELNIISEEGFGTTVTVILPIFRDSEEETL